MNDNRFWKHVDGLLDERLDPFEDRGVQDALRKDPAKLVELERLTGRLASFARLHRTPSPKSGSLVAPVLLVAASLIGVVAFFVFEQDPEPVAPEVAQLEAEPKSSLHVTSYRLTVSDSGPLGERTAITEDGCVARSSTHQGPNSRLNHALLTVVRSPRRLP